MHSSGKLQHRLEWISVTIPALISKQAKKTEYVLLLLDIVLIQGVRFNHGINLNVKGDYANVDRKVSDTSRIPLQGRLH